MRVVRPQKNVFLQRKLHRIMKIIGNVDEILILLKDVILSPVKFWESVKTVGLSIKPLRNIYLPLVFLLGIVSACSFKLNVVGESDTVQFLLVILKSILGYVITYYVSNAIILKLSKNFGADKRGVLLSDILALSLSIMVIVAIFYQVFRVFPIILMSLYALYVYALGVIKCIPLPVENKSKFITLSIVMLIFISGTTTLMLELLLNI